MEVEEDVIRQAQNGSLDHFSSLVRAHQDAVRAFVSVRLNNRCEADDLAQEVFVVAFRKIEEYDHSASFRAWLRGIAHNLLRNHWRKRRAVAAGTGEEVEALLRQELNRREDESGARLDALRTCFGNVGDDSRRILQWRYFEQLPVAEICRRLERRHSAVTMMLHRLRQSLRTCIQTELNA